LGRRFLIHGAFLGLFVMLNTPGIAERPRVKIDLGILRSVGDRPRQPRQCLPR